MRGPQRRGQAAERADSGTVLPLTATPAPTRALARSQAAERDELKYNSMLEMKATELKIPKISLEKMLA